MADINSVTVAGRLTRDSELKFSGAGLAILRCSVAVNTRKKDASGEWVDEANFFDITIFGKQAEALQSYLLKGRPVAVTGELRQDRWESEGQTRSRVYILANNIMLLNSGGEGMGTMNRPASSEQSAEPAIRTSAPAAAMPAQSMNDDFEDDIPF